eukprot:1327161-Lingulodinium_polyedra.AAC.1
MLMQSVVNCWHNANHTFHAVLRVAPTKHGRPATLLAMAIKTATLRTISKHVRLAKSRTNG